MTVLTNTFIPDESEVLWVTYIQEQIGFVLPVAQYRWLVNAVGTVATEVGCTIQELYQRLNEGNIRQRVIDAVLIAETRFFRDRAVVEFVASSYEAHLRRNDGSEFLVASMGCSTGQEVWSLAMALEQKKLAYAKLNNCTPLDYRLLGIDASVRSLKIAQKACYTQRAFDQIPKLYHRFWRHEAEGWQLTQSLKDKGRFIHCNVFLDKEFEKQLAPYAQKISLLLCQNMLIYFRRPDQQKILTRFVGLLKKDAFLVLGAGECLFWHADDVKRLENTSVNVWQK